MMVYWQMGKIHGSDESLNSLLNHALDEMIACHRKTIDVQFMCITHVGLL